MPSFKAPDRTYPPAVQKALNSKLQNQLELGIVELSDAESGSPVHMVKKLDSASGFRFCVDFSIVNKGVQLVPFPLPSIQNILDDLAGSCWFAKLDLRRGYWQFHVAVEDRAKLAFRANHNTYQYKVVPMGHVTSAFYMQRTMQEIFISIWESTSISG